MSARILPAAPDAIAIAAAALRRGEVVGIPTETVYGLAAMATDAAAVARIFAAKERPSFDPLIVHIARQGSSDLAQLGALELVNLGGMASSARKALERLTGRFWPGPLSVVLPRGPRVPDLVTSGLERVAIRMPAHPVAAALIAMAGPLAAPSANRFGRISPTTASHVAAELGERIELILDGGPCAIGVESTVIALGAGGAFSLLRPGGLAREAVEAELGRPLLRAQPEHPASSPGMLQSHYAPATPLRMLPGPLRDAGDWPSLPQGLPATVGILVQSGSAATAEAAFGGLVHREVIAASLSERGDLVEAAHNLFGALRLLDASRAEVIFAEPCPTGLGLGFAIQDRLLRAAGAQILPG